MSSDSKPKRRLPIEGAYNVRDLGGYPIRAGGSTQWKTFLRADSMHRLTSKDRDTLVQYGVRTVVDLRTTQEIEFQPNVFAGESEIQYVHHNLIGDDSPTERNYVSTGITADRIRISYTYWLDNRQTAFRQVLTLLAESSARPVIYHCAGGKDRTGVISALLLDIAGVDRETIAEDYSLTARYLMQRNLDGHGFPGQKVVTTWQQYQAEYCPPDGIIKTLKHLDDNYGGVPQYMQAIGLSVEQITSLSNALTG